MHKTASEIRISDWSSDVSSSALVPHKAIAQARAEGLEAHMEAGVSAEDCLYADLGIDPGGRLPALRRQPVHVLPPPHRSVCLPGAVAGRSEERRVVKEWASPCRSRWWLYH